MYGLRQTVNLEAGCIVGGTAATMVMLRPGMGDRKMADFKTFTDVLANLHPDQYFTAKGFKRLREIYAEQRAIRLANGGT